MQPNPPVPAGPPQPLAGYVLDGSGGLSATVMLVLAVLVVALYLGTKWWR